PCPRARQPRGDVRSLARHIDERLALARQSRTTFSDRASGRAVRVRDDVHDAEAWTQAAARGEPAPRAAQRRRLNVAPVSARDGPARAHAKSGTGPVCFWHSMRPERSRDAASGLET